MMVPFSCEETEYQSTDQSRMKNTQNLSAEQVRQLSVSTLSSHLDLRLEGHRYTEEDLWNVIVAAAAEAQSIESAAAALAGAPHGSTVRTHLRERLLGPLSLEALEEESNHMLVWRLPAGIGGRSHPVAIDLTLLPYHGEAAQQEEEIRRGPAKSGTTHFHCYATAYLIRKNKRLTVAMTYVRAGEKLSQVLARLLRALDRLGVARTRLYLDRQFFTVEVIGYFQQRRPAERVLMPVVVRGKQGGTRALLQGRRSHWTTYTMQSPQHGRATFRVAVVCKYSKGRYGRHGVEHFAYVVLGEISGKPQRLYAEYRRRFGIESSYRLMNALRIRTSSRCPKLRLLFVAVALLLANLWVYLKWSVVSERRRGGRRVQHARFRLRRFRQFLSEAVKALYGAVLSISIPQMHRPEPGFLNY